MQVTGHTTGQTIGLLMSDPVERREIADLLAGLGHSVEIAMRPESDLDALKCSTLLIVDENWGARFATELTRLKQASSPLFVPILVLAREAAKTIGWIRRGFDDVLPWSLISRDLVARLEVFQRLRAASQGAVRETEERYRTTFDEAPIGIAHSASDDRILLTNRTLDNLLGYQAGELLGVRTTDITFHDDIETTKLYRRQLLSRKPPSVSALEKRYIRKDGAFVWCELTTALARDAQGETKFMIHLIADITVRKVLENKLERLTRARHMMTECTRVLVHATDEDALLADMCQIAIEHGTYRFAWIGMPVDDPARSVTVIAKAGDDNDLLSRIHVSWGADTEYGRGPMGTAIRTATTSVSANVAIDPSLEPWRAEIERYNLGSFVALPLVAEGKCLGGFAIYAGETDAFGEEEINLLTELADDIAFGIGTLRNKRARESAEAALRDAERFARDTIDALSQQICVLDDQGNIVAANRAWRNFVKQRSSDTEHPEIDHRNYLDACDAAPGDSGREVPMVAQAIRDIIAGLSTEFSLEYPFNDPAGERWLQVRIRRLTEVGPIKVVVEHEEITGRKSAERELGVSEARFRSLTELSSDWYWEQDEQFRFTAISGCVLERIWPFRVLAIGRTRLQMHKQDPDNLFLNMSEADWRDHEGQLNAHQPLRNLLFLHRDRQGEIIYTEINGKPLFDEQGRFKGYRGTGRDITEQKRSELALKHSEAKVRAVIESSLDGVISMDSGGRIENFNPAAEAMFGFGRGEVMGCNVDECIVLMHSREKIRWNFQEYRESGQSHFLGRKLEMTAVRKDGRAFPVEIMVVATRVAEKTNFTAFVRDLTEQKMSEARLLHLAQYDSLTELPNRVLFRDRLLQALAQAQRGQHAVAVLFVDLDRFKVVNDTLGHEIGDRLLQQVARRIGSCLRSGDTVGRLGGDEFAVILTDIAQPRDARLVASKIMDALKQPVDLKGYETYVSASIGITLFPDDGADPEVLVKNADTAMYRAKEIGRNNYVFYERAMNELALERLDLENSLRGALERREFMLHYQPKVSLETGELVGMEALIRWQRPLQGLVSPAQFVPLLEETGLIVPVGAWVLEAACRQIKDWQVAGLRVPPIAINLSARQLQMSELVTQIRNVLDETQVAPCLIELEITESSLMHNTAEAVDLFKRLKDIGIGLSIDDFGTGYSSLSYLKRFSVDALKIDRSFVNDVNTDPDDAAIVRAIITMAHQLHLRVIAEGVETTAQIDFLSQNGCDEAQGFLIGRPMVADAMAGFLGGQGGYLPAGIAVAVDEQSPGAETEDC